MKEIKLGKYDIEIEDDGYFDKYATKVNIDKIGQELNLDISFFKTEKKVSRSYDGIELAVPIYYYDNSAIQGIFTADFKKLKELLPPGIEPIKIFPGRGLIAFTSFNYRISDIDPYNEFSIMIIVHKPNTKGFGPLTVIKSQLKRDAYGFVWNLPVTTPLANLLGRISYSFPKYITEITFDDNGNEIISSIMRDGKPEVTIKGKKIKTKKDKIINAHVLLHHNGNIAEAISRVNPLETGTSYSSKNFSLELGTGPVAEKLRTLEIGKMVRYDFMPNIQIMLLPGDL